MTNPITLLQRRADFADPHDCTDAADDLTILSAVFDTLVRRQHQSLVPHLAESWDVSPDARTWRFGLRPDVKFHDGTNCDANAVAQSLQRMAREDKGYTLGAPAVWRQYLGEAKIAADGLNLQITLSAPMADLLDVLVQGFIAAPASLARMDAGDMAGAAGTGPYRLADLSPGMVRLERATDHFSGQPTNQTLIFRSIPDADTRVQMLRDGLAQVATNLPNQADLGPTATRVETLTPVAIIYLMNAAQGPLADSRIRRALDLALDRTALVEGVMAGGACPLQGFISPVHFGAGQDPAPRQDLSQARSLLASAGYLNGLTLGVNCPTRLPDESVLLTSHLADQLAQIGVTLDVTYHEDREAYAHMVRRKEIRDLAVFDSSPLSTFRVLIEKLDARVRGSWWEGYHNPEVEALIDQARRCTDTATRAVIYVRTYKLLQQDPPWLTLYNPIRVTGLAGSHPGFALPDDAVLDAARLPAFAGVPNG